MINIEKALSERGCRVRALESALNIVFDEQDLNAFAIQDEDTNQFITKIMDQDPEKSRFIASNRMCEIEKNDIRHFKALTGRITKRHNKQATWLNIDKEEVVNHLMNNETIIVNGIVYYPNEKRMCGHSFHATLNDNGDIVDQQDLTEPMELVTFRNQVIKIE